MNFQLQHPKFKPKLLIFLLAVLIAVEPLAMYIQQPLTVYAGYNGDEGDDETDTNDLSGGPTQAKTGVLMYVVDKETGEMVTPSGRILRQNNNNNLLCINTKLGKTSCKESIIDTKLPSPFISDSNGTWSANGVAVREYLLTKEGKYYNYQRYLVVLFGAEVAKDVMANSSKYSLVIEPLAWCNTWRNGKKTSTIMMATADGWARMYRQWGQPEGDSWIRKMTHNALPNSMILQIERFGLAAPVEFGQLTSDKITSEGYGIHIIDLEDSSIPTWDQTNYSSGTPGPAPAEPSGEVSIIKNYYTKNLTTGVKTDDGCFERREVVNNIMIVDEPKYKVVAWKVSNTTSAPLDSTNWNPPGNITQQGTTTASIQLTGAETCVYVLLERTYEEPPEPMDYNYKLTQTQLTRRVRFSNPDNQNEMPKIQDHSFLFQNPAHQTECAGHSCDGCEDAACNCSLTDGQTCSTNHGKTCPGTHTCTWGNWKDNTLKISIYNTQKLNYPNILATKDGWNFETLKGNTYKRKVQSTRGIVTASVIKSTNWDYVCILMRGSDKLTLAQWVNNGAGVPTSTSANTADILTLGTSTTIKSSNISLYHTIKVLFFLQKINSHT